MNVAPGLEIQEFCWISFPTTRLPSFRLDCLAARRPLTLAELSRNSVFANRRSSSGSIHTPAMFDHYLSLVLRFFFGWAAGVPFISTASIAALLIRQLRPNLMAGKVPSRKSLFTVPTFSLK